MKRKISKRKTNSLYLSSFQLPPHYNDKKKATAKQKKMSHDAEIERKKIGPKAQQKDSKNI